MANRKKNDSFIDSTNVPTQRAQHSTKIMNTEIIK